MTHPPFYLVRISGMEAIASIGIHAFELSSRQRLIVSVTLLLEPPLAGQDEIGEVENYDFVLEGVQALVARRHFSLQETLCGEILDLCLSKPAVLGAVVQTDKPDVYPGVSGVACRMGRMGPGLASFPWWTIDV